MSAQSFSKYASVILDLSVDKALDYGIPAQLSDQIRCGVRVEVPLRGVMRAGYVLSIKDKPDFQPVQGVNKVLTEQGMVTEPLFNLAVWMAKYYCSPLRQVFKVIVPSTMRGKARPKEQLFVMRATTREKLKEYCISIRSKHSAQADVLDVMLQVKKGILLSELLEKTKGSRSPVDTLAKNGYLLLDIMRVDRSPLVKEDYFQTRPKTLSEEQSLALLKVCKGIEAGCFEAHLLYGVTGSGKTEVYLQAIAKVLEQKKGVIMLVPEISLTPQTIERFRSRFEGKIAVLHHRLSQGERYDEWNRILRGEAEIVIGARSAIVSPVPNLGLIIVDEEHESSYKQQEEGPCYHARDVAVMRGHLSSCPVILGSATPSLESFYNAQSGRYTLSKLSERPHHMVFPSISIVDMKIEHDRAKRLTSFSDKLLDGIKKRAAVGEQTILFLNRRGYHSTMLCKQCRATLKCKHCDLALTFHLGGNCLTCHLCGYQLSPPPVQCPTCHGGETMKYQGVGTEQIQKALYAILPEVRSLRIDADTTRHKGSHQKLLREFGSGKADVLIGTQMIAKGLHFSEVTLVGVINGDVGLNIPDFRASETIFQLMTQVAGRSGRGNVPGEVIIQTCLPENRTILLASEQNYERFFEEEIAIRKLFHYPPFNSLAKLTFSGPHLEQVRTLAEEFRRLLLKQLPADVELHPVLPSGYAKVKDRFRFQFLARGPAIPVINRAIANVQKAFKLPGTMKMLVDVNPLSTYF